jgi:hypothetical protein
VHKTSTWVRLQRIHGTRVVNETGRLMARGLSTSSLYTAEAALTWAVRNPAGKRSHCARMILIWTDDPRELGWLGRVQRTPRSLVVPWPARVNLARSCALPRNNECPKMSPPARGPYVAQQSAAVPLSLLDLAAPGDIDIVPRSIVADQKSTPRPISRPIHSTHSPLVVSCAPSQLPFPRFLSIETTSASYRSV